MFFFTPLIHSKLNIHINPVLSLNSVSVCEWDWRIVFPNQNKVKGNIQVGEYTIKALEKCQFDLKDIQVTEVICVRVCLPECTSVYLYVLRYIHAYT